jgi:hypothetical protein
MNSGKFELKTYSEGSANDLGKYSYPKHSIRSVAIAGVSLSFAFLTACGGIEQPSPALKTDQAPNTATESEQKQSASDSQQSQQNGADSSDIDQDGLALTDQISTALKQIGQQRDLLGAAFKISGFRVSLVDNAQGSYPIVSFAPVEGADFYQVLRCTGSAALSSGSMNLEQIIADATDLSAEIAQQVQHPFWEDLTANPGCSILHERLTRTAFIDQLRDLPSVKYIARACSAASQALDPNAVSCSPIVSVSNLISVTSKQAGQVVDKVQEEIAKLKSNIENASVDLTRKTKEYAAAVVECEKTNRKQNLANHRKQLLLAVLSVGAKIGGELLNSASPNPIEAFKSIWKDKQQLAADTRPILDVLKDVFVTEKNNIQNCIKSEFKATEAGLLLADINAKTAALAKLAGTIKTAAQEASK